MDFSGGYYPGISRTGCTRGLSSAGDRPVTAGRPLSSCRPCMIRHLPYSGLSAVLPGCDNTGIASPGNPDGAGSGQPVKTGNR